MNERYKSSHLSFIISLTLCLQVQVIGSHFLSAYASHCNCKAKRNQKWIKSLAKDYKNTINQQHGYYLQIKLVFEYGRIVTILFNCHLFMLNTW